MSRWSFFCYIVVGLLAWSPLGTLALALGNIPEEVDPAVLLPDDGDPHALVRALAASTRALAGGEGEIPPAWQPLVDRRRLRRTNERLAAVLAGAADWPALRKSLAREFRFYRLQRELLVTGYYEPELAGRLQPDGRFRYPLHRVPEELYQGRGRVFWRRGRLLHPCPPRAQLLAGGLLAGRELVWLADPVGAYLLQVQGSGRIRLADGRVRRLGFAAHNGHPYRSIGRVLVEEGALDVEEASLPAIQRYLEAHPQRRDTLFAANPRYVFFRWRDDLPAADGPLGSLGVPLVPGRSVAVDPGCYPLGGVGFLVTSQPRRDPHGIRWVSLHRFVALQDTGGAIRGPGRLDFFFGHGPWAETGAGLMRNSGALFLLLVR